MNKDGSGGSTYFNDYLNDVDVVHKNNIENLMVRVFVNCVIALIFCREEKEWVC